MKRIVSCCYATLVNPVKNHHEYKNEPYLNELNVKMFFCERRIDLMRS